MRRNTIVAAFLACLVAAWASPSFAAVGCTLRDPDRDVMRIFPEATGYSTEFVSIADRGGDSLAARVEAKLGDGLDPTYEANDVAYAYYTVLRGTETIGRLHGVNEKGKYGGMQIILATDPDGVIVDFYYQKLSSPEAKRFRDRSFTGRFVGLSLADFEAQRGAEEGGVPEDPVSTIRDPSERSAEDFAATLRGIRKNLILLEEFHPAAESTEHKKGRKR